MANNKIEGLESLSLVGIGAAIPKSQVDAAKKDLQAGSHTFEGLVRIKATINKGEAGSKPHPAALPFKAMVVALLSNMGEAQRKAFIRNMGEGKIKIHGYTEKNLDADWKAMGLMTTKEFSGTTTVKASVELVEEAEAND